MNGFKSPVSSTGRRNTYYKLSMWSVTDEEEIRTGWLYSGSEDSAIQFLSIIRCMAAERGLSGGFAIQLILAVIGFVVFIVGVLSIRLARHKSSR